MKNYTVTYIVRYDVEAKNEEEALYKAYLLLEEDLNLNSGWFEFDNWTVSEKSEE